MDGPIKGTMDSGAESSDSPPATGRPTFARYILILSRALATRSIRFRGEVGSAAGTNRDNAADTAATSRARDGSMYGDVSAPESSKSPSTAHPESGFRTIREDGGNAVTILVSDGAARPPLVLVEPLGPHARARWGRIEAVRNSPMRTNTPPSIDVW